MKKTTSKTADLHLQTISEPPAQEPVPRDKNSFVKTKKHMEQKIKEGKTQHEKVAVAGNLAVEKKPMSIKPRK